MQTGRDVAVQTRDMAWPGCTVDTAHFTLPAGCGYGEIIQQFRPLAEGRACCSMMALGHHLPDPVQRNTQADVALSASVDPDKASS
jgi:hypothetical protein